MVLKSELFYIVYTESISFFGAKWGSCKSSRAIIQGHRVCDARTFLAQRRVIYCALSLSVYDGVFLPEMRLIG